MNYLDSFQPLSEEASHLMHRIISYNEFPERFEPIGEEDGPVDDIPAGTDPAFVCSIVDTDVGDSIISGIHVVNRFAYWICRVPVPAGEHYEVVVEQASDLP